MEKTIPEKTLQSRICHLITVHSPFDDRIFHKEAKTMTSEGYEVVLIVQHNKEEIIDDIRIVPLSEPNNRFERMTKTVWRLFTLALNEKADVYHFHDPELIPIGIMLKVLGQKVIYDVHEDVSKQILNKEWIGNMFIRKLIAFIVNAIEQFGAFLFDGIVTATPDIEKKFNPSRTILIRNLPNISMIDNFKPLEIKKQKPIIIYTGGLSKIRGIKEIIQAMGYIKDKAELWLLGTWETEKFKEECEVLKGWEYTKYLGHIPYGKHYSFIKIANIGLVNLLPLPNQTSSMPNKLFEYMACALPMIISNFPYWQEIFAKFALFVNPYDPEDIASKTLYLLNNPDKAKHLGVRGRQLIEEKYSWETERQKLIDLYEKLLK